MSNVFSALRNSNADNLAMQLSLLEHVTRRNALVPYFQKAGRTVTRTANLVPTFFKWRSWVQEPSVVELKDRVQKSFLVHKGDCQDHLVSEIRRECCKRLRLSETETDTTISVKLIRKTARIYGIDDWLTPAEQAEAVSHRYQEESLTDLRKAVAKMSPQQRADLEKQVTENLQDLPREQKEKMARDLKLADLSGDTLIRTLIAAGGPFAGIGAISATGFGGYLALTTIIHAVATTALGITLPFAVYTTAASLMSFVTGPIGYILFAFIFLLAWRPSARKRSWNVFAGLVSLAVQSTDSLRPSGTIPPSASLDPGEIDKTVSDAQSSEREKIKEMAAATANIKKLDQVTKQLEESNAEYKRAVERVAKIQKELESVTTLSDKKIRQLEESKAQAEVAALAEMERSEQYEHTIEGLKLEKEKLQKELRERQVRQESFEEGEGKKLQELWAVHLKRMKFERQPVCWTAHRKHRDRMSLERKLVELHDSEDPAALSRGKMGANGEHHLKFRLDAVECRLYYRMEGGLIIVSKIGTNQQTHR